MKPTAQQAVTTIDFDPRKSRFIITAPKWLVQACRNIPNRRWDVRRGVWTAPAIRANADYLSRSLNDLQAAFTKIAQDKIDEILSRARERHQRGNFPTTFTFKTPPMPHQSEALDALYGLHTMAWFMDMGTGKTWVVTNIHAALAVDKQCDAVVVLCPLSLRRNWQRQLEMHMPVWNQYTVHLLSSDPKGLKEYEAWLRASQQQLSKGVKLQRWLVAGIESLISNNAMAVLEKFTCSSTRTAIVCDEAHKIKNASAERTKRACRLARMSEWRTIMTGTPVSQGPFDLFAMFEFLDPDIIGLGDFYSFQHVYGIFGGHENREVLGYQNLPELMEIIAPFTFQARKSEVLKDLPPKTFEVRELKMSAEQQRLYTTMRRAKIVATGDKQLIVQNALEKMLRLQEIAGGYVSYEKDVDPLDVLLDRKNRKKTQRERIDGVNAKIEEVLQIAQESDQSTIVWCLWREELAEVAFCLRKAGYSVGEFHGGIKEDERERIKAQFQAGKLRFIVANVTTGGTGHDFYKATIEIFYNNSFSLIDREQAEDRAHRIGQRGQLTIIDLVYEKTVDVTALTALQAKLDMSEYARREIDAAREDLLYGAD